MAQHNDLHNSNVHYTSQGYAVEAQQAATLIDGLLKGHPAKAAR